MLAVKTKDGTVITQDQIESIEFTPFFALSTGPGEVLHGRSLTNNGDVVDKFVLAASGSNGKVKRGGVVEKSAVPQVDKPKPAPKPAKPPEKK